MMKYLTVILLDVSTICLQKNDLQEKIFAMVVEILMERGLILKKGNNCRFNFYRIPVLYEESRKET